MNPSEKDALLMNPSAMAASVRSPVHGQSWSVTMTTRTWRWVRLMERVASLLKDARLAELELAVRAVAGGGNYLTPAVSKQMVDAYLTKMPSAGVAAPRLTLRQREVLQAIAEGNGTKEIARKLDISVKTVETHRAEIMQRLDIHDVAGLVRYAIQTGISSTD